MIGVFDSDWSELYSSAGLTDDQAPEDVTAYWDCWAEGRFYLRLEPRAAGRYSIEMTEAPGWEVAVDLEETGIEDWTLDYAGDVDYFAFHHEDKSRECEVKVATGQQEVSLFWVNTEDVQPEALVSGTDLTILENYPGPQLADQDSYYGVTGETGRYAIEGKIKGSGLKNTLVVIGIVGAVVVVIAIIALVSAIDEGCDSLGGMFDWVPEGCSGSGGGE